MPRRAGGEGMEKVHISAACLSLTPSITNQCHPKACWGSWSCERARPPGLSSAWEGSLSLPWLPWRDSQDPPGPRETRQYILFLLGTINLAKQPELAVYLQSPALNKKPRC